jgi:hypothetical protein
MFYKVFIFSDAGTVAIHYAMLIAGRRGGVCPREEPAAAVDVRSLRAKYGTSPVLLCYFSMKSPSFCSILINCIRFLTPAPLLAILKYIDNAIATLTIDPSQRSPSEQARYAHLCAQSLLPDAPARLSATHLAATYVAGVLRCLRAGHTRVVQQLTALSRPWLPAPPSDPAHPILASLKDVFGPALSWDGPGGVPRFTAPLKHDDVVCVLPCDLLLTLPVIQSQQAFVSMLGGADLPPDALAALHLLHGHQRCLCMILT